MSIRLDDLLVGLSLAGSAWALHSFGFRARSLAVAIVLMGLPVVVWAACRFWLDGLVGDLGLPQALGALPALVTYLEVVWIVTRQSGGLTYRLSDGQGGFVGEFRRADLAMRRAFQAKPATSTDGQILAEPTRKRLEIAVDAFRTLRPPPGEWTRLFEERLALHEAYLEVLLSPAPLERDALGPLEEQSRAWKVAFDRLAALDDGSR
jgi:hypothetical protein